MVLKKLKINERTKLSQKLPAPASMDIDLRNDENRPSFTSGAATVAELQEKSPKNTINEMGDAITNP